MIIELAADFNLVIEESNFKRYHHRRTFSLPKLQNTQDTLSEKKCSRKSALEKQPEKTLTGSTYANGKIGITSFCYQDF